MIFKLAGKHECYINIVFCQPSKFTASDTDTVSNATLRCGNEKRGGDCVTISLTLLQTFELTVVSDDLTFYAGNIALHPGRD